LQAAIYHFQGMGGMDQPTSSTYELFGLKDFNSGTIKILQTSSNSATFTIYNAFLTDANNNAVAGMDYAVRVMNMGVRGGNQDMLTPVPLPGALLLLGAGLTRLAAYARRRQDS
jgi:hypothetical protein